MKRLLSVVSVVLLLAVSQLFPQQSPKYVWAITGGEQYLYAAGWGQGVFRSTDGGETWQLVDSQHREVRALLADSTLGIFAANQMGGSDPDPLTGIFHSPDQGLTWLPANQGLTNHFVTSFFVVRPPYVLAGVHDSQAGKSVFRSCDAGNTWVQSSVVMEWGISAFASDAKGVIYTGTRGSGVWKSMDQGKTWSQTNQGLTSLWITSVVVESNRTIFASTYPGGGIFRSVDDGEDWELVYSDMANPRVMCLTTVNGSVFAGSYTDGGIYLGGVIRSTDGGTTWRQVTGTEGTSVATLFAQGNNLYSGTLGHGVMRPDITTAVDGPKSSSAPLRYELEQNYPNPFNPGTTIKYQLPVAGHVRLSIYTVLGQEVRRLIDRSQAAAYHVVVWDGKDSAGNTLPSGIYFYRLESGSFTAMKKMIMVK